MRCGFVGLVIAALSVTPFAVIAAPPGTLVSADAVVETPGGMQAWRVRYWTSSDRGAEIEVTGMVVAPREAIPRQPRDVLAWAHGTWGIAQKCALSQLNFFEATPGLTDAIRRNYVVVAPDYPGLGSDMPHPYLGGISTANSILDAVRAARSIAGTASGNRFAVWGESQGGHAALWSGERVRSYAPDLTLIGVAAAAPPTDLVENLRSGSDPSIRAFLTAFTAYSWSQHYGAPLATLGTRSTQGVITRLAQNNCIVLGAKPKLGTMLGVAVLRRDLKNVNLGRIEPWAQISRDNSAVPHDPGVPVLIAQNARDVIVSPAVTLAFARKLCRDGARLRYIDIAGRGHETSAKDSATETLDWIDDLFDGRPVSNDCSKI